MDVYWLEQKESDVPAENHENQWLSAGETRYLTAMRFPKRRTDWRLGRWTAKRALAARLHLPADLPALANIEIRTAPSGAPEAFLLNLLKPRAPVTISLSHSAGAAICAVALSATSLGCDLEMVEPRIATFAADYFTANEQTLVEQTCVQERPLLVTLLWSAKESALKALNTGLRLDTNSVEVSLREALPLQAAVPDDWRPLHVRHSGGQIFSGWWRHANQMIRTVVSAEPLPAPISLADFSQESSSSLTSLTICL